MAMVCYAAVFGLNGCQICLLHDKNSSGVVVGGFGGVLARFWLNFGGDRIGVKGGRSCGFLAPNTP